MQSNGVAIENGAGTTVTSKTKLTVSNGTCLKDGGSDEIIEGERSAREKVVKRKKPRKLTEMEADIVRLMGQHLREMGYHKTLEHLVNESDCPLEHPKASVFRSHVLEGDWEKANKSLDELSPLLEDPTNIEKMRLLLLQEKYLEQLELGQSLEALHTLRYELAHLPLHHSDKQLQVLTGYMMYPNKDDLRQAASWPGVKGGSRKLLVDKLQAFLPASVMLPPQRLQQLMNQALQFQVEQCPFHYLDQGSSNYSLLTDHICSKCQFPSETVHTLTDHSDEVWFLKFSNDGNRLATGSRDGQIILWNFTDSQPRKEHVIKGQAEGIAFLAWSPDDSLLLSCGREDSPEIIVFLTETGEVKCHIQNSADDSLTCGAWCSDGHKFYVGGNRGQFYQCSVNGSVTGTWEGVRVKALAAHPTSDLVYAADTHHRIRQYNFNDKSSNTIVQETHPVMSFILSKDGRQALVNVANQSVHVWDLHDRVLLRRFQGVTQSLYTIHSSFGGNNDTFIASGSEDHNVYIWHTRRETPVAVLKGHSRTVNCVSWNPVHHQLLASASDDGTVRVWSTEEELKAQLDYQRLREKEGLTRSLEGEKTSTEDSSTQRQSQALDNSETEGMDTQQSESTSELDRTGESASSLSLSSERLDDSILGIVALAMDSIAQSSASERTEPVRLRSGSQPERRSLRTDSGQWSTTSEIVESATVSISRLRSSSHGQESSVDPDSSALSLASSNGSNSQGDISQSDADFEEDIRFSAPPESGIIRTSSRTGPSQGGARSATDGGSSNQSAGSGGSQQQDREEGGSMSTVV